MIEIRNVVGCEQDAFHRCDQNIFRQGKRRSEGGAAAMVEPVAGKTAGLMGEGEMGHKCAEAALSYSEHRYRTLFETMAQGFCVCEMLFDQNGEPIDYRFLEVNPSFAEMTGLQQAAGKTARQLIPNLEAFWIETYGRVVLTGEAARFENQSKVMNRWFEVNAFCIGEPQSNQFAILFTNIGDRKRFEQERERFLSIGSDLQVITSIGRYFQWISPTFERTLGWTLDEMTSRPWTDFVHPDDINASVLEIDSLFSGNTTVAFENRYRHKNGSYRWFLWNAQPYPEEQVVYGVAVDITDRKQAEAELQQKNAILNVVNESAPTPIFVKDRRGRIIYANPATLEVLGKSAAEVIGYRDCDLYPSPEDAARVMENDQRIMESGQTEVVEESPDGVRTFLGMKSPYRNASGEVIGLIGIANDITDRVRLERDRERILRQEQAAREAAESANRIKDEFLAVLSHELRSPLNPILGWSRLLQSGKLDKARTAQALATIERNAKLQSELIEDLLDVSRILQSKLILNVSPVYLTSIVKAAIETVHLAAEAKSIKLETNLVGEIGQVLGDATRLQQIIWNLLSNAVKFTPEGGSVTVQLGTVGNQVQITVVDTGKGIPTDFLPYVFDYFRQADGSTTRKFGGLGLGLAIVRHLVELHGGTVWAESRGEELGATFTVRLPLMPTQPTVESNAHSPEGSPSLGGVQVLVVDDEADSREFIAFVLEQAGAIVFSATTPGEAFTALTQSQMHVLLSDIGMPGMDGYMLMRQIRALPPEKGGQIPAIALTAYAGDFNQQQALKAGFQQHLSKPVDPEALVRAIIRVLA